MIYLFEDRKGRMQQYLKEELNSNIIKESIFDCDVNDIDSYIETQYNDAKCILFHKSYSFPQSGITADLVKQKFLSKKIPFVFFSGGVQNNFFKEKDTITGTADSGDMYNNLLCFINEYKLNSRINIPLLLFGKDYLLNSLLDLQNVINKSLFKFNYEYYLNEDELDEIKDAIDSRINEEEFSNDKLKLIAWIDNRLTNPKITVGILKSQIQKLIDKYYE